MKLPMGLWLRINRGMREFKREDPEGYAAAVQEVRVLNRKLRQARQADPEGYAAAVEEVRVINRKRREFKRKFPERYAAAVQEAKQAEASKSSGNAGLGGVPPGGEE